jgi:glycosyltransferase involved in cell wall biosynthesis
LETEDFTVLLPTYDRDDLYFLFDKSVDSCINNSLRPKEIIIVIDGPIRREFQDKVRLYERNEIIRIIWLPKNVGLTAALNEGLKHVQTKYVFRADGDDVNRLNRFRLQMGYLKKGFGLVSGAVAEFDEFDNKLAVKRVPSEHEDILKYCKRRNPFNHMASAYELNAVLSVGGYPDLYLMEDWGLWVLLLEKGVKSCNSQEIFVDVAGGARMYDRRGGFKNVKGEYGIQKFLIQHAGKSYFFAVSDFLGRIFLMNMPSKFKNYLFLRFLRS